MPVCWEAFLLVLLFACTVAGFVATHAAPQPWRRPHKTEVDMDARLAVGSCHAGLRTARFLMKPRLSDDPSQPRMKEVTARNHGARRQTFGPSIAGDTIGPVHTPTKE